VVLYAAQLVANALWTWLFFHTGAGAFAEIAILWLLIVATIVTFWRAHIVAGALMLPYLARVSFAAALAWSVWHGNPTAL
jgi:benzodiazapine receptor